MNAGSASLGPHEACEGSEAQGARSGKYSSYGFTSPEQMAFAEVNRFYDRPHPGTHTVSRPIRRLQAFATASRWISRTSTQCLPRSLTIRL